MGLLRRLLFGAIKTEEENHEPYIPEIDLSKKTCPKMNIYTVKGRFPETKRIRTVRRVALEPLDQDTLIAASGLYDIQKIDLVDQEPPSERQISYAIDLGIKLQDDYSKNDVSCLITRALHDDEDDNMVPVDRSLAKMVAQHNICLSEFSGEKRALDKLWYQMSEEEKIKFFIFCVHQDMLRRHDYDLENSPYIEMYDQFVDEYKNDDSFHRSLCRYIGSDLSLKKPPNKQRKAYKIAEEFLSK